MDLRPYDFGWRIVIVRRVPRHDTNGDRVYDGYGNLTYVEIRQPLDGIAIWRLAGIRQSTSESGSGEFDRTAASFQMALPFDVAVDAIDHIEWNNKTWEVEGEPQLYRHPITGSSLQTVIIRRVEG